MGAIAYPKTIDWRIVLPVYGTSNAMEIQFNWQREHRTCNGAFPPLVSLPLFDDRPLRSPPKTVLRYSLGYTLTWMYVRNEFLPRIPAESSAIARRADGGPSELPPWTILWLDGVRVRARKLWRRMDRRREQYRAVCMVSGNVSCLAGDCRLSGMYSVLVRSLASCRD